MKHIEKIVLHPKLENNRRQEVIDWCMAHMPNQEDWGVNSNYDKHGCFNVTILGENNISVATAFMLAYPDSLILEKKLQGVCDMDPEAALLFDFGD
jgi:hypothetical protein